MRAKHILPNRPFRGVLRGDRDDLDIEKDLLEEPLEMDD